MWRERVGGALSLGLVELAVLVLVDLQKGWVEQCRMDPKVSPVVAA